MDLLQLQYFRAIAQHENMTKAAEALFASQPNLSTSMSRLESDLDVKLFERRRGKISLTPEGRLFLEHVQNALGELDAGVEAIHSSSAERGNSIRVASSMPDLMGRILARTYSEDAENPLSIKQVNCPNRMVPEVVASEVVDFGLYFGELDDAILEQNVITECERVLLLRRDHPLANRKYISLEELDDEDFICNHFRDDEIFLRRESARRGFVPRIRYECDSLQMEAALLVSRNAVSVCPAHSFQRILADEPDLPVSCLRFSPPLPGIVMSYIRRRGHMLTPASLEFFAHLNEHFGEESRRTDELFQRMFSE